MRSVANWPAPVAGKKVDCGELQPKLCGWAVCCAIQTGTQQTCEQWYCEEDQRHAEGKGSLELIR